MPIAATIPTRIVVLPKHISGTRPKRPRVNGKRRQTFKAQARELPQTPGVYFFHGPGERLLYVGKAKCLRERVRSYFADTTLPRPVKLRRLLSEMTSFTWQGCGSELEALLTERRLIAQLRPEVNYQLKRFDFYPYLHVTDEEFPRLTFTREAPETPIPAGYFLGPFTTAKAVNSALEAVRGVFLLRTCEGNLKPDPLGKACFYHDIQRCAAPCIGAVNREEYAAHCAQLVQALETGSAPQLEKIRARMLRHAAEWRFEDAQELKEQLDAIAAASAKLRRLQRMRRENNVVIAQPSAVPGAVALFFVRGGLLRQLLPEVTPRHCQRVRKSLAEIYTTPPPARPFTAKQELDEMLLLDRWLRSHGREECCVWMNDVAVEAAVKLLRGRPSAG